MSNIKAMRATVLVGHANLPGLSHHKVLFSCKAEKCRHETDRIFRKTRAVMLMV